MTGSNTLLLRRQTRGEQKALGVGSGIDQSLYASHSNKNALEIIVRVTFSFLNNSVHATMRLLTRKLSRV